MLTSDLPEQPKPDVLLYCPGCCAEYSATRGDYFRMAPDEDMEPCECGEYLVLAKKTTTIEPVELGEAELEP